jgi:hypothetical protein
VPNFGHGVPNFGHGVPKIAFGHEAARRRSLLKMAKRSEAKSARQLIGLFTQNIFLSLGTVLPVPCPSTVFVGLLRDAH